MCTQNQAIGILGEVYHACKPIFGEALRDAFLYGSYARGDYHNESDVDILLTVALEQADISRLRSAVALVTSDLSLKHDITVSVTVKPLAHFLRYVEVVPFYKNVVGEGIRYAI